MTILKRPTKVDADCLCLPSGPCVTDEDARYIVDGICSLLL